MDTDRALPVSLIGTSRLEGPSIWSRRPVTRLIVRANPSTNADDPFQSLPFVHIPDLLARLKAASSPKTPLPPLPPPARSDTWEKIAILAINLQRMAGIPVTFATARQGLDASVHELVFESPHAAIGSLAGDIAIRVRLIDRRPGPPELLAEYQDR
ncbi:MAG: hypothetical protein AB7V46_10525, partial [Thermomicrobiales bacterium]